jgi:hypothetical protein
MKPLRSALTAYAGIAGVLGALAAPSDAGRKLSGDEFKVVAMGVLAMAFGQALGPGVPAGER